MQSLTYQFSLLSATFSHGAYQTQNFNRPELRSPSIKGMIRWWHKALDYSEDDAHQIFGQVANRREGRNDNCASRLTIRIAPLDYQSTQQTDFMPHKGHRGGSKSALKPGNAFSLEVASRRSPLSPKLWQQVQRATEAWLLLGGIGQRSNRAAGSISWDEAPTSQQEFELIASDLLQKSKIRFAFLDANLEDSEYEARLISGDFLKDEAFGGTAPFGAARPRKPSPLKLKCVRIEDELRLLAIWDRRNESPDNLTRGVKTLVNSNKVIGTLLQSALPKLVD